MKPLLLPYIFNILVLIPVCLTTLLGGAEGGRRVFQDKFPESAGIRTILGSLWTAILIGSVIGLFHPVSMSPLLLIQIIYKSLWLLVFVLPLLVRGQGNAVPWGVAGTFLFVVLTYPWVIPWGKLFGA
ncbi:MAG: hypothetical protein WBQ29_18650 [Isosphaeraceae bacterium]|jgi:hypothetical protein